MIAIPLSGALGGPLGGWLLGLNGVGGLAGWQWLFLVEGIPSFVLGFVVLRYLTERAGGGAWLPTEQRDVARSSGCGATASDRLRRTDSRRCARSLTR